MSQRSITATDFKAKCLALLDEVNEHGEAVTITKRGKPVAVLQPAPKKARRTTEGMLAGKIKIVRDIVDTSDLWKDWEIHQKWLAANPEIPRKRRRKAS